MQELDCQPVVKDFRIKNAPALPRKGKIIPCNDERYRLNDIIRIQRGPLPFHNYKGYRLNDIIRVQRRHRDR